MTRQLYTPKEVAEVRALLLEEQKNIDPVIGCVLQSKDAVTDHCHESQYVRAALHRQTNAFEGLVANAYRRCLSWWSDKNLPDTLRSLAEYLERPADTRYFHPSALKKLQTKFNTLPEGSKRAVLASFGLSEGGNSQERKKLFQGFLKQRQGDYGSILAVIESSKERN